LSLDAGRAAAVKEECICQRQHHANDHHKRAEKVSKRARRLHRSHGASSPLQVHPDLEECDAAAAKRHKRDYCGFAQLQEPCSFPMLPALWTEEASLSR